MGSKNIFSEYFLLCSSEEGKPHRFRTAWAQYSVWQSKIWLN